MPDDTRLSAAIAQLYAVLPEDFVRTRTGLVAEAKTAGDPDAARTIGALRRPSAVGWTLNTVARESPAALQTLLEVGARLRDAQSRVDAVALQALRPERDAAVDGYVAAAAACAQDHGRLLGQAASQEVRATAIAALADEAAAEAVRSGHLLSALSYSGFGEVDVSDALAHAAVGPVVGSATPPAPPASAASAAGDEQGARQAEVHDRVRATAQAKADAEAAKRARDEERAVAEQALASAEERLERAEELLEQARRARREAARERDEAQQSLRRLRKGRVGR